VIRLPPVRPLWQRVLLPLCGLGMVLLGTLMFLTPALPGFWLVVVGAPFLFAFSRSSESWAQGRLLRGLAGARSRLFRVFPHLRRRALARRARKQVARDAQEP
jgi:uncharacterized membrane protein YbaN (DUF454 family)